MDVLQSLGRQHQVTWYAQRKRPLVSSQVGDSNELRPMILEEIWASLGVITLPSATHTLILWCTHLPSVHPMPSDIPPHVARSVAMLSVHGYMHVCVCVCCVGVHVHVHMWVWVHYVLSWGCAWACYR